MTPNEVYGVTTTSEQQQSVSKIELTQNPVYGVAGEAKIELTQNQVSGVSQRDANPVVDLEGSHQSLDYETMY